MALFNNRILRSQSQIPKYPPPELLVKWKPFITIKINLLVSDMIKEFSEGETVDDENLKCYMNCMFHEMEVVHDNGNVNLEKIQDAYGDGNEMHLILLNMMKRCLYPKGDNLCEKAYWLNKCWKNADPVLDATSNDNESER
ncbi:Pheromone-binding protein-related protein 6 [Pseudolycoriella hygida]|uniref:Pheromone-binding protein-related protein 6 n=1 Tax=Pseudolycoriella hygida TaxID=35572 RepID=A0A9Q0MV21_9DIPT|nr:Pheromone-binding protein-related protein 6 [Pseudolycoriella hygida]